MTNGTHATATDIATAQALLERLGVSLDDLVTNRSPRQTPTFAQYIPTVYAAMHAGRTRDNYHTYWKKLLRVWPERHIDEPTVSELKQFIEMVRNERLVRRTDRGGHGVARQAVDAVRCLYQHAADDNLIAAQTNPAAKLTRPTRLPTRRSAVSNDMLEAIYRVAEATRDPALHVLIVRLHTETACRRGGVLALTRHDLDPARCLIRLREKGQKERWQPVSPSLMEALLQHHTQRFPQSREKQPRQARNGKPITIHSDQRLLRYHNGDPITTACYDTLWRHVHRELPYARVHGLSSHWLRHTTLKWVERSFGHAVARAYAGHAESASEGATSIYTRADIEEVAFALATLTGEPHPLALSDPS
ncbi:site-specific integrase [Nocardia vinacea]|uniref:tyrosine-type recombinase/integrase n=1 Tax=Nocardia vinacea TaxID=96468 RepID=UPI0033F22175